MEELDPLKRDELAIIKAQSEAQSEARKENWSLGLSSVVTVIFSVSYIYYWAAYGKELPIPDMAWAIALSPFGTIGLGKILKNRKQSKQ